MLHDSLNDRRPCLTRFVQGDDSDLQLAGWAEVRRRIDTALSGFAAQSGRPLQTQIRDALIDVAAARAVRLVAARPLSKER